MDVNKFLQSGNVTPNPNYNPKTKKGRLESPLLVDYNVGESIDDKLTSNIVSNTAKHIYSLESDKIDKYAKYNTYLNPYDSQEELNRSRAENQSAFEQFSNAVVQAVGNEVVVGTALGLSNLVDFALNIGNEEGEDDYTNPISTYLENVQENIRERFEIYRKDPNATWAIGDFGWWADNAVSIASTASMLIPTLGVSKGLSLIGKATRLGKLSKGIAKMANKTGIVKYPAKFTRQLNAGAEITTNALLSRTMEGYLEARDVYKSAYDETLSAIKDMSEEEKTKLFENNQELLKDAYTNEEIASRIASVSADETFRNDYAMLLFDMAQFKAISNIWKGNNKIHTATKRLQNKAAIKGLTNEADHAINKIGFIDKQKEAFSHILKNPLTSLTAIEWSEGIEEGYQGIQVEKGKEVAKKIIDPTFTPRSIESYLTDGAIWEQAFWGVLGGVGFQAVGKGLGKLQKIVTKGIDKQRLSEQDFNKKHTSYEEVVKAEINNRKVRMDSYINTMSEVNAGRNPLAGQLNINGEVEKDTLTPEEVTMWKEQLTSDFVTDMVINAADAGNWDLFKEFVTSKEFAKYFQNNKTANGVNNDAFVTDLVSKMDEIYDQYSKAIDDIYNSVNVESPYVASLLGRNIVRHRQQLNNYDNLLNRVQAELNQKNADLDAVSKFEQLQLVSYINNEYKKLDEIEKKHKENLNNHIISREAYDNYIKDINRERNRLYVFAANNLTGQFEVSNGNTELNEFILKIQDFAKQIYNPQALYGEEYQHPTLDTQELINDIIALRDRINYLNFNEIKTQESLQNAYDELSLSNDSNIIKRYNESVDKINTWLESQENINEAKENLMSGNIPNYLKEDVKILKLGHHTTASYLAAINNTINEIKRDRLAKEESAKKGNINGQKMSEEITNQVRDDVQAQESKQTPPSTGEKLQDKTEDPNQLGILTDEEKETIETTIKQQDEEIAKQTGIGADPNRIIKIKNTTIDIIKNDSNLKQSLIGKSNNSIEAKQLFDRIKEELAKQDDINPSDDEIQKEVNSIISLLNRKYANTKKGELQKAADEVVHNALTNSVEESSLDKLINTFIKKYIIAKTMGPRPQAANPRRTNSKTILFISLHTSF